MKVKQVFDGIFQAIFWLWNLTFLSIVYLGILPLLAGPLIMATRRPRRRQSGLLDYPHRHS